MPKRTPIRLFNACVILFPRAPRRGRILTDRGERAQSAPAWLDSVHEARVRFLEKQRALEAHGIPLVRRPRAARAFLSDVDGALLPERGLRPHGGARRQGGRRMAPARL